MGCDSDVAAAQGYDIAVKVEVVEGVVDHSYDHSHKEYCMLQQAAAHSKTSATQCSKSWDSRCTET